MARTRQVASQMRTTNQAITGGVALTLVTAESIIPLAETALVWLFGWAQVTTPSDATTCQINMGTIAPSVVRYGELNTITLGAAGGSTEQFYCQVIGSIAAGSRSTFYFQMTFNGVAADGNMLQSGLIALTV